MKLLADYSADELKAILSPAPSFRAGQLFKWVALGAGFDEMSDLPKQLRESLRQEYNDRAAEIIKEVKSKDGSVKLLYRLHDGNVIEGIFMPHSYGNTLCVSTQVGCRMGCAFCASGLDGLVRNLSAGEIYSQVIAANRRFSGRAASNSGTNSGTNFGANSGANSGNDSNYNFDTANTDSTNADANTGFDNSNSNAGDDSNFNADSANADSANTDSISSSGIKSGTHSGINVDDKSAPASGVGGGRAISNVVLMGSGEPLDNYAAVTKFIALVTADGGLNISQRSISLSTCGLVDGIRRLADDGFSVTLSISLHATTDELRRRLMPVAKAHSIAEVLSAAKYYFQKSGRRVIFEYAMIGGLNKSAAVGATAIGTTGAATTTPKESICSQDEPCTDTVNLTAADASRLTLDPNNSTADIVNTTADENKLTRDLNNSTADIVNTTAADASRLKRLLRGLAAHLNLIPLNYVEESALLPATKAEQQHFLQCLEREGLSATIRRSAGSDTDGACGQLRNQYVGQKQPISSEKKL